MEPFLFWAWCHLSPSMRTAYLLKSKTCLVQHINLTWQKLKTAECRHANKPQWHKLVTLVLISYRNENSVILGSDPLAVCCSPAFRKTPLFSFLRVHFLSYVISPVISIVQSLQPSQHKCTTANWNLVKKKKFLAHKFLLEGLSICFLFQRVCCRKLWIAPRV